MYFTYSPLLSDTLTQTQTQTQTVTATETQTQPQIQPLTLTQTSTPSTTLIVIPPTNNGLNLQGIIAVSVLGSILGSMLLFFIVLKIIGSKKILKSLESKVEAVATQAITTQGNTLKK
jgi:carbohydrate-binding DOMON domain-containing protein